MESKKMVLGIFIGNFESYTRTRYSGVVDEEQKKSLVFFIVGFSIVLLKAAMAFFISLKGAICKKKLGNPALNYYVLKIFKIY